MGWAGAGAGSARVLGEGANVLVAFDAAGLVCRVPSVVAWVRPDGGRVGLEREVAFVQAAVAAGAPVLGPSSSRAPGPWRAGARWLTCWPLVAGGDASVSLEEAAVLLRSLHDAVHDAVVPELAPLSPVFEEVAPVVAELQRVGGVRPDVARELLDELTRVRDALGDPSSWQPVHGDAHVANLLSGGSGPLWSDCEDACLAPVAWDLACLTRHASAFGGVEPVLDAYGASAEVRAALPACAAARELQGVCWHLLLAERSPVRHAAAARARLAAWRGRWR